MQLQHFFWSQYAYYSLRLLLSYDLIGRDFETSHRGHTECTEILPEESVPEACDSHLVLFNGQDQR